MKIKNLISIPVSGKQDNSFVGIRIFNNQIEFHYPETYKLSATDKDLRNDILSILKTVSLAKTKTSDYSTYNSNHLKNNIFPLGSYLWIINDYLTYGHYVNRESKYSTTHSGKINWKRTLKSNPIISRNNIVFKDIVHQYKSQTDNILTEIYNCCVKQAIENIGWLYGISFDSQGIDYDRLFLVNNKYYLNVLNTELLHTFDDAQRIRLNNMKNIIIGLDEDMINAKEMIYGVDSYDYVYEKMIDQMFSNINNIKDFYPSANWNLVIDGEKNSSNLRPDTVFIKDDTVFIVDAKNYRYGVSFNSADLPDTTSIQKQITYGEYVKKVKEGQYKDIYNAFIIPYSKIDNIYNDRFNKNLEFFGYATAKWTIDQSQSNMKIVGILIDMNFLVNSWNKNNAEQIDVLSSLISSKVYGGSYE